MIRANLPDARWVEPEDYHLTLRFVGDCDAPTLKHLVSALDQIEADSALPYAPGDYAAITAIGVIGAGAAPISVFDTLMAALGSGGRLVLSFNDHALEDPANEARIQSYLDDGRASLLLKEYGDHLPGIGLKSNVYVLEKREIHYSVCPLPNRSLASGACLFSDLSL